MTLAEKLIIVEEETVRIHMNKERTMIERIRAYVKKYHMLEQSDRVITGISGGADSVCLLFVLLELQKEIGFEIQAVHIHHGLRGEDADRDAAYVEELTAKHGVPCKVYCCDVESEAKKRKQSIEEAGREVRREAFYREMKACGGTKIALAHHRDDNAETFLMNLARGAGLQGLGGIRPVSGEMIRPLLCVSRREIEEYLRERDISYCTDETNYEDDYTRNRIRNHVLPYLETHVNAAASAHINEAMGQIQKAWEYIDTQAEKAYAAYVSRTEEGAFLLGEEIREAPEAVREMVYHKALKRAAGREKDIGQKHVALFAGLWEMKPGSRLSLPYLVTAVRTADGIRAGRDTGRKKPEVPAEKKEYNLKPGEEIQAGNMAITAKLIEKQAIKRGNVPENIYTKWFDYGIIKGTVKVRKRLPGDYITIDEEGNRQKLKSYFINNRIPKEERDNIWLIAQGSHILWVIGYRMGHAARITEHTEQVLEIKIYGGEAYGRDN